MTVKAKDRNGEPMVLTPSVLTVEQCAQVLQCSVSMVEKFIVAGELVRVKLAMDEVDSRQRGPKNWRVRREMLDAFIRSKEGREPPRDGVVPRNAPRPSLPLATGTDGKRRLKTPKTD